MGTVEERMRLMMSSVAHYFRRDCSQVSDNNIKASPATNILLPNPIAL